jgi:uncharacterized protein (DUF2147 family)
MRMTKVIRPRTASGAVLLMLFMLSSAQAQTPPEADQAQASPDPEAIVGLWSTEPDEGEWSRVEVYPCDDGYCGHIVWLSHPLYEEAGDWGEIGDAKIDWNNEDDELRSQPVLGLELMHSFRFDDGKWKDGRIYDPDNGKTYRSELTLAEDGQVLKVRGYVRIAFVNLGRTTEWTRVIDP